MFLSVILFPSMLLAFPSVYASGTTLYSPEKAGNAYTVFYAQSTGAILIDMNGNIVHKWEKVNQHPAKMMPGGYVMVPTGKKGRVWGDADSCDLEILDWDGKTVWKQEKSGVHHDFQREGNPVGYFAPKMDSLPDKGRTLILSYVIEKIQRFQTSLCMRTIWSRWTQAARSCGNGNGISISMN